MERKNFAALTIDKINRRMSNEQKDMTINNALESVNKGVNQLFNSIYDFSLGGLPSRFLGRINVDSTSKEFDKSNFTWQWNGNGRTGEVLYSTTADDYLEWTFYSDYIDFACLYMSGATYAVYIDDIFAFSATEDVDATVYGKAPHGSMVVPYGVQFNNQWKPVYGKHKIKVRKLDSLPTKFCGFRTCRQISYENLEIFTIKHVVQGVTSTSYGGEVPLQMPINITCSDPSWSAYLAYGAAKQAKFHSFAGHKVNVVSGFIPYASGEYFPFTWYLENKNPTSSAIGYPYEAVNYRIAVPPGTSGEFDFSIYVNVIAHRSLPLYVVDSIRQPSSV